MCQYMPGFTRSYFSSSTHTHTHACAQWRKDENIKCVQLKNVVVKKMSLLNYKQFTFLTHTHTQNQIIIEFGFEEDLCFGYSMFTTRAFTNKPLMKKVRVFIINCGFEQISSFDGHARSVRMYIVSCQFDTDTVNGNGNSNASRATEPQQWQQQLPV